MLQNPVSQARDTFPTSNVSSGRKEKREMRVNDRVAWQEGAVGVHLPITLCIIFAEDVKFLDKTSSECLDAS